MTENPATVDETASGDHDAEATAAIDPRLLELLVCPLTKQDRKSVV